MILHRSGVAKEELARPQKSLAWISEVIASGMMC